MHLPRAAHVALLSAGTYWMMALVVGGHLPLVERHMFRFAVMDGPVAVPLFRADGELHDWSRFTDFAGLPPEAVDVAHAGFQSSVEQHFHAEQAWLAGHQAAPDAPPGPVQVEVGLVILEVVEGRLTVRYRVDATGTARRRAG